MTRFYLCHAKMVLLIVFFFVGLQRILIEYSSEVLAAKLIFLERKLTVVTYMSSPVQKSINFSSFHASKESKGLSTSLTGEHSFAN